MVFGCSCKLNYLNFTISKGQVRNRCNAGTDLPLCSKDSWHHLTIVVCIYHRYLQLLIKDCIFDWPGCNIVHKTNHANSTPKLWIHLIFMYIVRHIQGIDCCQSDFSDSWFLERTLSSASAWHDWTELRHEICASNLIRIFIRERRGLYCAYLHSFIATINCYYTMDMYHLKFFCFMELKNNIDSTGRFFCLNAVISFFSPSGYRCAKVFLRRQKTLWLFDKKISSWSLF